MKIDQDGCNSHSPKPFNRFYNSSDTDYLLGNVTLVTLLVLNLVIRFLKDTAGRDYILETKYEDREYHQLKLNLMARKAAADVIYRTVYKSGGVTTAAYPKHKLARISQTLITSIFALTLIASPHSTTPAARDRLEIPRY